MAQHSQKEGPCTEWVTAQGKQDPHTEKPSWESRYSTLWKPSVTCLHFMQRKSPPRILQEGRPGMYHDQQFRSYLPLLLIYKILQATERVGQWTSSYYFLILVIHTTLEATERVEQSAWHKQKKHSCICYQNEATVSSTYLRECFDSQQAEHQPIPVVHLWTSLMFM